MFFKKTISWVLLFSSEASAKETIELNKIFSTQIGKHRICVVHTKDGFYAMNDKCPHNGASLSNGTCSDDGAIVCPVHRYRFDLKTGRAKSGLGDVAITYPIEVREDGVFIGFEEKVWSLF